MSEELPLNTELLQKELEAVIDSLSYFKDVEEINRSLVAENQRLRNRNEELEVFHANNLKKIAESEEWRKRFELAVHTPEYKQNAEDAFKRGEIHGRTKLIKYLQIMIGNIDVTGKVKTDD